VDLVDRSKDDSYFQDRCILVPLNTDIDKLNYRILSMLPGDNHTCMILDTFLPTNTDSIVNYINQPKLLHSMNFSNYLNHEIKLKVGALVVLLRNLNPST